MQPQPRIVHLFAVIFLALSAAFIVDQLTQKNAASDSINKSEAKVIPSPVDRPAAELPENCAPLKMQTVEAPQLSPDSSTPDSPDRKRSKSNWVTGKPVKQPMEVGWLTHLILRISSGITSAIFLL